MIDSKSTTKQNFDSSTTKWHTIKLSCEAREVALSLVFTFAWLGWSVLGPLESE